MKWKGMKQEEKDIFSYHKMYTIITICVDLAKSFCHRHRFLVVLCTFCTNYCYRILSRPSQAYETQKQNRKSSYITWQKWKQRQPPQNLESNGSKKENERRIKWKSASDRMCVFVCVRGERRNKMRNANVVRLFSRYGKTE